MACTGLLDLEPKSNFFCDIWNAFYIGDFSEEKSYLNLAEARPDFHPAKQDNVHFGTRAIFFRFQAEKSLPRFSQIIIGWGQFPFFQATLFATS